MDELIYRQDAANILCDWCDICPKEERDIMHCDDVCPQFARIPSARKKGHWTNIKISHTRSSADCSECGVTVNDRFCTAVHFCPNCGADMRCKTDTHSRDIIDKLPAAQQWIPPRRCIDCENFNKTQLLVPQVQQQKKGHWVENHDSDHAWKCSECGCGYTDSKLSYCYDCGADMRGEADG